MRMRSPLYMCGENSSEVSAADGWWLTASGGRCLAISLCWVESGDLGEAIFPVRCQRAIWENEERTWTDGAGRSYVMWHTHHTHTLLPNLYLCGAYGEGWRFLIQELKKKQTKKCCWFKCFWASNELLKSRQCGNITYYRSNTIWSRVVMHPSNFFKLFFFLRGGTIQNFTRFISPHHEDSQLIIKVKICEVDLGGGGHLFNRSMSYSNVLLNDI